MLSWVITHKFLSRVVEVLKVQQSDNNIGAMKDICETTDGWVSSCVQMLGIHFHKKQ
jgi:hypothetical protein